MGYSLSWLLILVFGPLAGRLYDRFGAHVVVPVGACFLGSGLALTGYAQTLWHDHLCFGVLGAAGVAFIMMPATAITSRWFTQSRGAAMGIISAGSSASAILFYPLNAWLIGTLGWRQAIGVYGLIVVLGIAPLAAYLYRRQSTEMDITSHEASLMTSSALSRQELSMTDGSTTPEWTLKSALFTLPLWASSPSGASAPYRGHLI